MIIDFHTHIFPPGVRERREEYVHRDPTFAEMYADPKAKIATAEDLLASMDEAGVDVSVALGFAWRDHDDIVRHNDYLMECALKYDRISAFPCINMEDVWAMDDVHNYVWARGLGELRPESQGWDLRGPKGRLLANVAAPRGLILLFHVTEPGERSYPGRSGLDLADFRTFAETHTDVEIVGAHLGGGYYTNKGLRVAPYVDTAAQPFLYPGADGVEAIKRIPANRLLFGSDFPLIGQGRQLAELRAAIPDEATLEAALGGNARKLLGI